jgi:enoyl-[acyl-carrier-protein] reductase (NADH)
VAVAGVGDDHSERGAPTTQLVEAAGATAVFVRCDVTPAADLAAAVFLASDLAASVNGHCMLVDASALRT